MLEAPNYSLQFIAICNYFPPFLRERETKFMAYESRLGVRIFLWRSARFAAAFGCESFPVEGSELKIP